MGFLEKDRQVADIVGRGTITAICQSLWSESKANTFGCIHGESPGCACCYKGVYVSLQPGFSCGDIFGVRTQVELYIVCKDLEMAGNVTYYMIYIY